MTSRTNYYKTVTQIFNFDEHAENKQPEFIAPPKETFYVDAEEEYDDEEEEYEEEEEVEIAEKKKKGNDPAVFGPPLWFSLHNASAFYPEKASPLHAERMKNVILGIPVLIPCEACKEHATNYIEQHKHYLMEICKTKNDLFKFLVDFHNFVNHRLGKRVICYEEAHNLYH
jgi:hypothetical protein